MGVRRDCRVEATTGVRVRVRVRIRIRVRPKIQGNSPMPCDHNKLLGMPIWQRSMLLSQCDRLVSDMHQVCVRSVSDGHANAG